MTLGHSLATLRQAWQRRPAAERLRLGIGGGISLALASYLLLQRIDLPTWQGVETPRLDTYLLDALPPITAMDADDWRQVGLRHSLVLDTIESDDGGWQLSGRTDSPAAFERFSAWAAQQGWWALDWSLSRDSESGMNVEARFVALLEREPATPLEEPTP
ncbi:hypothetical protein [Litchfieldella xinjiangensis]|uniref:hypothetical protein n=1 Tax=Litchfieldella xinjiangensis TaxID=1166948 RepID=UPI0005B7A6F4|nr:hypothetical protein [Halomonas xinjiangensis]